MVMPLTAPGVRAPPLLDGNLLQLTGLDQINEEIPFLVGENGDVAFLTDHDAR